jgi:hypothetical protein
MDGQKLKIKLPFSVDFYIAQTSIYTMGLYYALTIEKKLMTV